MRKLKLVTALLLIILAFFMAAGTFTFRRAGNDFPTEKAVQDLKVISLEPHSVLHQEERNQVRNYLYGRLEEIGGTPEILRYDTIANVYCKFEPPGRDTSCSYLLLVAHLDSRFPEQTPQGIVCSYGAADDGYGLVVILELVRGALEYAEDWCQGLKILFTDSEERNLDGIRCALERDNALFDNVGLVVNVEARGVKGPALLFETSSGNAALMDFYTEYARYPYTYSLTSAVYDIMPNYTDFTLLKPLFPGYNFSVIDNLHYYHNDRDNFSNIHPESIAHYGVQLAPMVKEYLTGNQYSDPDYFRSRENKVVFTIPGLGTFSFSRTGYCLLNAVTLALFVLTLTLYVVTGRIKLRKVFYNSLTILGCGVLIAAVGTGLAYAATRISGVPFSFVSTKFLSWDWILTLVLIALTVCLYIWFFTSRVRRSESFVFEHVLGLLLLILAVSAVLLVTVGENFFLLLPALCAIAALLLHMFVYMNVMSLPALLPVVLTGASFLYNLYTALTVGSLGIIMFLVYLYAIMAASLVRCFMYQRR